LNGSASVPLSQENNFYDRIENLSKGTYQIAIAVNGQNYERIYSVTVGEPNPLAANSKLQVDTKSLELNLAGAAEYHVQLNSTRFSTRENYLTLNLRPGMNRLTVSTDLGCQGIYEEEFFVSEKVQVYPNPTSGPLNIYVAGIDPEVNVQVKSIGGIEVYRKTLSVDSRRKLGINLSDLTAGLYIISLQGPTVNTSHKIIKT
jgi:hypothetical protein